MDSGAGLGSSEKHPVPKSIAQFGTRSKKISGKIISLLPSIYFYPISRRME